MIIPRYKSEIAISSFINPLGIKFYDQLQKENDFYFDSATSAIYEYLKSLGLPTNTIVAVPLYSCSSVWQAVYDARYKIKFLDIGLDTNNYIFDLNQLDNVDVLIFINYFGFEYDFSEIKQSYPKILIISDNTHKNINIDNEYISDAKIYSFNFHKPIVAGQGGVLRLNHNSLYFHKNIMQLTKRYSEIKVTSLKKDFYLYVKSIIKNFIYIQWIYFLIFPYIDEKDKAFNPPKIEVTVSTSKLGFLGKMILGNQLKNDINRELINNYIKIPEKFRLSVDNKKYLSYFPLLLPTEQDKKNITDQLTHLELDYYTLWGNFLKNSGYYGCKNKENFPNTLTSISRIIFLPSQLFLKKNINVLEKLIAEITK